jgi:hypothetical protein
VQTRRDQRELLQAWPKLAPSFALLRIRLRKILGGRKVPLPLTLPPSTYLPCGCREHLSAGSFARALLQVETYLGAEHLEEKFVYERLQEWKLAVARIMSRPEPRVQPYDRLKSLADELACNLIVAPLTPTTLIALLRSGSAKRIPEPVWWQIMHFCFDCQTIASRSSALAHISSVDDGALCHMNRSKLLTSYALQTNSWDKRLLEKEWSALRTRAFNNQKKEVSFIPDGVEEDYRLDYNTGKHAALSEEALVEKIDSSNAQTAELLSAEAEDDRTQIELV